MDRSFLSFGLGHRPDDVGIAGVGDGQGADPEVLSASGAELDVVSGVVVNAGLGQHGVVLNLGLPESGKKNNISDTSSEPKARSISILSVIGGHTSTSKRRHDNESPRGPSLC